VAVGRAQGKAIGQRGPGFDLEAFGAILAALRREEGDRIGGDDAGLLDVEPGRSDEDRGAIGLELGADFDLLAQRGAARPPVASLALCGSNEVA
jgi:hypothetical protein